MRFEGRLKKDGRFWIVEVPALDAMTQGRSRREAFAMAKDLIETMANVEGFEITVHPRGGQDKDTFEVEAEDVRTLVALMLRRQRERQGLSLADAAQRLGQRSRNAYARYEQGKATPTVEKLEQLLRAIAPGQRTVWRFAA